MGEGRGEGSLSALFVTHRDHTIMNRALAIQFALMLSTLVAHSQGTFLFDQQSATNTGPRGGDAGYPILLNQPIGQSFSPALSSLAFVQMKLQDFLPGNGI